MKLLETVLSLQIANDVNTEGELRDTRPCFCKELELFFTENFPWARLDAKHPVDIFSFHRHVGAKRKDTLLSASDFRQGN